MDLTRTYSNHQGLGNKLVTSLERLRRAEQEPSSSTTSVRSAPNSAQPRRVIERLGLTRTKALMTEIEQGVPRARLAERYGISESSIKRLIRSTRQGG